MKVVSMIIKIAIMVLTAILAYTEENPSAIGGKATLIRGLKEASDAIGQAQSDLEAS